jgi:hypothetical protein
MSFKDLERAVLSELREVAKDNKIKMSEVMEWSTGEVTGHHHAIVEKGARLYELKGELYMEVTQPVIITHEEHKPLPIPPGIFKIGRVQEYDYFQEMERKVLD